MKILTPAERLPDDPRCQPGAYVLRGGRDMFLVTSVKPHTNLGAPYATIVFEDMYGYEQEPLEAKKVVEQFKLARAARTPGVIPDGG